MDTVETWPVASDRYAAGSASTIEFSVLLVRRTVNRWISVRTRCACAGVKNESCGRRDNWSSRASVSSEKLSAPRRSTRASRSSAPRFIGVAVNSRT